MEQYAFCAEQLPDDWRELSSGIVASIILEAAGTWELMQCPYYQASTGGPKDLPGKYGPGTCMGGCWEEPRCMT